MISVTFDDLHQLMFFFCLDPRGIQSFTVTPHLQCITAEKSIPSPREVMFLKIDLKMVIRLTEVILTEAACCSNELVRFIYIPTQMSV